MAELIRNRLLLVGDTWRSETKYKLFNESSIEPPVFKVLDLSDLNTYDAFELEHSTIWYGCLYLAESEQINSFE